MKRAFFFFLGVAISCRTDPPVVTDLPVLDQKIYAGIIDAELTFTGSHFGAPSTKSKLFLGGAISRVILSTDPSIVSWTDQSITLLLPDGVKGGQARVETADGSSEEAPLLIYKYDFFDIPPTNGTNAAPLALAVDPSGNVWVNEEFHLNFQRFIPSLNAVQGIQIPKPPDPGPFATTIFGDHQTQISICGEDIIVDPTGRIWFTEGGGFLYNGTFPNHSRVVSFEPTSSTFQIYNIPGDQNEIIGLAWDEARDRLWVAQGGATAGAALIAFNPDNIPFDNQFDFSTSLDAQVCQSGAPDDSCYHFFPVPAEAVQSAFAAYTAHMTLDAAGDVWFTNFGGNTIGRLDPETESFTILPLSTPIGLDDPVALLGSGPWQLLFTPEGDLIFNEFFDSTISRLPASRLTDPSCLALDAQNQNPCIEDVVVPGVDLVNEQVHSIVRDDDGRIWFSQHTKDIPDSLASVGFVTPDFSEIVVLPALGKFPGTGSPAYNGMGIDQTTGQIWFTEFLRKRLGRLTEQ